MTTVRQKQTFPPDVVAPWDDELAFRSYLPMLTYAKDPYLRSVYLRSIARSWELLRPRHDPWFNFIYGAVTGYDCEAPQAAATLRAKPLDLASYDGKGEPRGAHMPHQWLEAYWMGRYYGMIDAPKTSDRAATTLGPSTPKPHGGAHFGGPKRPAAP
jgi:hypothetical protein